MILPQPGSQVQLVICNGCDSARGCDATNASSDCAALQVRHTSADVNTDGKEVEVSMCCFIAGTSGPDTKRY